MKISRRLPSGRSTPAGFLGLVGMVSLIELFLAANEHPYFATNAAMNWRRNGQAARRSVSDCEILCLGDSQVEFAVLPRVLEHKLGVPAYNLALFSGSPTASYYQLVHALDAGARPGAIVVDFQPNVFVLIPQAQVRVWPELLGFREIAELGWAARDARFFTEMALSSVLPSVRTRQEIRSNVLKALRGIKPSQEALTWLVPLWRNWNVNKGAYVLPKTPEQRGGLNPGDEWLLRDPRERRPVPLVYLRKVLDLAAEKKIKLFWLLPPMHPTVLRVHQQRAIDRTLTNFALRIQSRYPNIGILDARYSGYPASVFADFGHLDRQGATALSADVAEALGRRLAGTGPSEPWVDLPAYRDRSVDAVVEDIDQSRLALRIRP